MPDWVYLGGISIAISVVILLPNIINRIIHGSWDEREK